MKAFYRSVVITALCLFAVTALADFNDGVYAYSRGEYKQAYDTMRPLAEISDHGLAQYYLGMMYLRGDGVEQNYADAAKWFDKAARQRIKQAQFRLAELYADGKGVPRDYEYAYAWYRVGSEHKHSRSIDALAGARENLDPDELEEAEKLSRELIEQYGPEEQQQAP